MADQIATRYGILGEELSRAVLKTIALTAGGGVGALDRVRRRLEARGVPTGFAPEPPSRRWQELLASLFPTAVLLNPTGPPSPDLLTVTSDDAAERTIRKLFLAAASFLLAQSTAIEENLDYCRTVDLVTEHEADDLHTLLGAAVSVSYILLDTAENGGWRTLLTSHMPASAVTARSEHQFVPAPAAAAHAQELLKRKPAVIVVGLVGLGNGRGKTSRAYVILDCLVEQITCAGQHAEIMALSHDRQALDAWVREREARGAIVPQLRYASARPRGRGDLFDDLFQDVQHLACAIGQTGRPPDHLLIVGPDGPWPVSPDSSGLPWSWDWLQNWDELPDLSGCDVVVTDFTAELQNSWRATCEASGARNVTFLTDHVGTPGRSRPPVSRSWPIYATVAAVLGNWSSTGRALAVVLAGAASIVLTILALGHADLSAPALLAGLAALALNLFGKLAKLRTPRVRQPVRKTPAPPVPRPRTEEVIF